MKKIAKSHFRAEEESKMSLIGRIRSFYKHNPLILKLLISGLAVFFVFRVTLYNSSDFPSEHDFPDKIPASEYSFSISSPLISRPASPVLPSPAPAALIAGSTDLVNVSDSVDADQTPAKEKKCDLFTGDWIPNSSGPLYTNETCNFIESPQNCMMNGRPDTGYLYWRWNPRNCELPEFEPRKFLEIMRNKSWALVGDSISRNHVQSLLCMLSQVEKAVEVYHDEEYRSRTWLFPSYNFKVYVMFSPYLADAAIFEDSNGVSSHEVELHLDRLDKKWTDQYLKWDYMIISTGKWFLKSSIYYENNTIIGCHNCPRENMTEIGFDFAYRKSLRSALDFISTSDHKGLIFFRTSTPDHFEGGEWFNGGGCNRTVPFKEGETEIKELHKILRRVELEEFERAIPNATRNGVNLKLLDLFQLSLLRPDGHPGPYRYNHPSANNTLPNDCLHWCLPGPIDSWNHVIMEMVMGG
ncbi:hypothetical protein V2J09_004860 [Rumex salicifolius]